MLLALRAFPSAGLNGRRRGRGDTESAPNARAVVPPSAASAVTAALRASACGVDTVQLYLEGGDGRLAWAAASSDGPDLALAAEVLGTTPSVLAFEGSVPSSGVGVRWVGAPRGAVVALASDALPADLHARVSDAAETVRALLAAVPAPAPRADGAPPILLRHIVHELRGPLTVLLGYADLVGDDAPEMADALRRVGAQVLDAVGRLSALAMLDPGPATARLSLVRPGAAAEEVVGAYRAAASARRTTLHIDVAGPDVPVLLDARRFDQLLRVLVGAAVVGTTDGRVDGRLTTDGQTLVFDLRASPAAPAGHAVSEFVEDLVGALGGTADDGPGDTPGDTPGGCRWTVRLPGRAVPVVEFADEEPAEARAAAPRQGARR